MSRIKPSLVRIIVVALVLSFLLSSCGNSKKSEILPEKGVEGDYSSDTETVSDMAEEKEMLDLTKVSRTMIYSTVYNLLAEPEECIGKTVKMQGRLGTYQDGDVTLHACLVTDVTECCELSVEFRTDEDIKYPEDGTEVTVTGIFSTYKDSHGILYSYLDDAVLEF